MRGERAKRASLDEDEHTRDESREMATDIMATSTTKLTHPIRLARLVRFARPSLKMRLACTAQELATLEKLVKLRTQALIAVEKHVHDLWSGTNPPQFFNR